MTPAPLSPESLSPESPPLTRRASCAAAIVDALRRDDAVRARVDAIVDAARAALDVPAAQLSVMTDRQVTASVSAPSKPDMRAGTETPFDDTVCVTALRIDGPLQIDDASVDSRVSSIPAVVDGMLGAYLGMPVRAGESLVAVLCASSPQPREWTDGDRVTLAGLAQDLEQELTQLHDATDHENEG